MFWPNFWASAFGLRIVQMSHGSCNFKLMGTSVCCTYGLKFAVKCDQRDLDWGQVGVQSEEGVQLALSAPSLHLDRQLNQLHRLPSFNYLIICIHQHSEFCFKARPHIIWHPCILKERKREWQSFLAKWQDEQFSMISRLYLSLSLLSSRVHGGRARRHEMLNRKCA